MLDIQFFKSAMTAFTADPAMFLAWAGVVLVLGGTAVLWARKSGVETADRTIRERDATIQSKDATIETLQERLIAREEDTARAQRDLTVVQASLSVLKEQHQQLRDASRTDLPTFIWTKIEDATEAATISTSSVGSYVAGIAQQGQAARENRDEGLQGYKPKRIKKIEPS